MIVIKHEKRYPNESQIYISYFKGQQLGFLNYSDIEHAKEYQSLQCARQDFVNYGLNPNTHKYKVL